MGVGIKAANVHVHNTKFDMVSNSRSNMIKGVLRTIFKVKIIMFFSISSITYIVTQTS